MLANLKKIYSPYTISLPFFSLILNWVHSHLVAALELAAVKSIQVVEHDVPSAAEKGASEKEHDLCGLVFPKDSGRLQAQINHAADGTFHAAAAGGQIQMPEGGILHADAVE